MRVVSDDGSVLDATFSVEPDGPGAAVIIESRGGRKGVTARNADYNMGLELLLRRLGQSDAALRDALVDSRDVRHLPPEERRLQLDQPYPIVLSGEDHGRLRRMLTAAQRPIGRRPGARGSGNRTRRMRMVIELPRGAAAMPFLAGVLQGTAGNAVAGAAVGRATGRGGQGAMSDAATRAAVEQRAMKVASTHFADAGWTVSDVSATESFDLLCRHDDDELHVEVKGTTSAGDTVILTDNEVRHMRAHYPDTALAVVAYVRVRLGDGGAATAYAGDLQVIQPWSIDESALQCVQYRYLVPRGS